MRTVSCKGFLSAVRSPPCDALCGKVKQPRSMLLATSEVNVKSVRATDSRWLLLFGVRLSLSHETIVTRSSYSSLPLQSSLFSLGCNWIVLSTVAGVMDDRL